MKKSLSFLFLSTFFLSFVSAFGPVADGLVHGLNTLLDIFTKVMITILNYISLVLFASKFDNELIYTKILFFFLLITLLYFTLKKNKILSDKNGFNFFIALIVSIIAVRYLPNELIRGIQIPYGALAVAILVFIPLMIFFFWLHGNPNIGGFGRRFGWVIYLAGFISLWLNDTQITPVTSWVYKIGLAFAGFSLIFDGSVHKWLGLADYRRHTQESNKLLRHQLSLEIDELRKEKAKYAKAGMVDAEKDIQKRIEKMEKSLRKFI